MLNVFCPSPKSPNGPSGFKFSSGNSTQANSSTFSPTKAIQQATTPNADNIMSFSERLVSFIHWNITTSDPRTPIQTSPMNLFAEKNRRVASLNAEKNTLLQSCKETPELAACVEILAKKASLPKTSTISYGKLPHKTQNIVNETADLMLLTEQAQVDTATALGYDPLRSLPPSSTTYLAHAPQGAFIDLCVEKVLLVSIHSESLKDEVKTLPKHTQRSFDPILASSTKRSEAMTKNLMDLTSDRIQNLSSSRT